MYIHVNQHYLKKFNYFQKKIVESDFIVNQKFKNQYVWL